jgi:hypothetical protein
MSVSVKLAIYLLTIINNLILFDRLDLQRTYSADIGFLNQIDISQVKIAGISYGMERQLVLRKLGRPHRIQTSINCMGKIEKLIYPGLTIDLETIDRQKYVTWIQATGINYGTDRQVKIGDSIDKAIATYNPSARLSADRTLTIMSDRYGDLFLIFKSNKHRQIVQMSIAFEC